MKRNEMKNGIKFLVAFYTLAEGIIILSRNVERIEGGLTDPIKYLYS